jgi:hypothetical protein
MGPRRRENLEDARAGERVLISTSPRQRRTGAIAPGAAQVLAAMNAGVAEGVGNENGG